jgi:hypothetical protein
MSQLAVNSITDGSGGATATINGYTPTASNMGGKNRIINGDMRIDQRNAGASVTPTASAYTVDRMQAVMTQASKYSVQQNAGAVTPPSEFTNYLGFTSTSAYSVLSGDVFALRHNIEGFNVSDLGWGTANAQTVTLSFWVRSSLTGTFGGSIMNSDQTRAYPFSYAISAANTWEQKTVTIAGDTTGTWLTTNGIGLMLNFSIGTGSTYSGTAGAWAASNIWSATGATSVVGTSGATFFITGVQLEAGSVATPFERRSYGQELALCQRYFQKMVEPNLSGYAPGSAAVWRMGGMLPVQMRAAGTVTLTGSPPILSSGASSLTGVSTNYSNNGNSIEFDGTLNTSATNSGGVIKTVCSSSTTAINISAEL